MPTPDPLLPQRHITRHQPTADKQPMSGVWAKAPRHVPSYAGTMVYFSVADITGTLNKVVANKGKELIPMTSIGEYGFCAYFEDSEGNRIGLHTM